jgi:hypothetical protein
MQKKPSRIRSLIDFLKRHRKPSKNEQPQHKHKERSDYRIVVELIQPFYCMPLLKLKIKLKSIRVEELNQPLIQNESTQNKISEPALFDTQKEMNS